MLITHMINKFFDLFNSVKLKMAVTKIKKLTIVALNLESLGSFCQRHLTY